MTKTKKILITVSLCTFAVAIAFGIQAPQKASAQSTDLANAQSWLEQSFTMEKGASARIADNGDGLRFSAEWSIEEQQAAALETAGAKYGMIIAPLDSIPQNGTLDENSVFGADSPYYFAGQTAVTGKTMIYNVENAVIHNIDNDANLEMTGAIINLRTQNFVREYVGVAYVAIPTTYEDDQTTGVAWDYYFAKYYDNDVKNNTRSMYYVAQGLIEREDVNSNALQTKYIDAYAATAANYAFSYTVKHHYNDSTNTEICWGDLNSIVSIDDVLEEQSGWGYDETEQTQMQASTSGTLYAGGRLTLDVYYSKTVDTANMTLADVGLAKASTFEGVEVENLATGIENVTYTYDNGEAASDVVPMTAGKYTVTANFTVEEGYLPVEDSLTANVRLVGDNATIAEHGANGFEINYTLSSATATATDFTTSKNYIFMGMPSYEEAVANTTTTGSTIRLSNPVSTTNFGTRTWNAEVIDIYGPGNEWFDALEDLTQRWSENDNFYKKNLVYSVTANDVTTYYMDFKVRVENNENGSSVTLFVDNGLGGGTPIWGITSTKKIGAGYAGVNYNACVEGRSYLSNFSVTELTKGYKIIRENFAVITSTDFEVSYTLSKADGLFTSGGWNYISYNNASDFNVGANTGKSFTGEYIGLNGAMKAQNNSVNPTWSGATWVSGNVTNGGETATITTNQYTVNKAFENAVTTFNSAPLNAYVNDFDGDGNKEVKFKWTFKNVTENDTTTATVTCYAMNANGEYVRVIQVTGMDAITTSEQTVGLYYDGFGFQRKSFVSNFKVVCNDAA